MKTKIIFILFLSFFLYSCSKKEDSPKPGDENTAGENFKIADYMIVGETFWGNSISNTPPYIITFGGDDRADIYTLDGKSETSYEVSGNRILLTDIGYIDIANGEVSDMVLAGANLKKGKLIKLATLEDKAYPTGEYMVWSTDGSAVRSNWVKDYKITIAGNTITETWMQKAVSAEDEWFPVTKNHSYTKLTGSGGVGYNDPKLLFYINPDNGKMVCWFFTPGHYHYYQY